MEFSRLVRWLRVPSVWQKGHEALEAFFRFRSRLSAQGLGKSEDLGEVLPVEKRPIGLLSSSSDPRVLVDLLHPS